LPAVGGDGVGRSLGHLWKDVAITQFGRELFNYGTLG